MWIRTVFFIWMFTFIHLLRCSVEGRWVGYEQSKALTMEKVSDNLRPTPDNRQLTTTRNQKEPPTVTLQNQQSALKTNIRKDDQQQTTTTDRYTKTNNQNRHLTTNSQWPTGRKYRKTRFETTTPSCFIGHNLEAENYKPTLQHYNHLQTWTQQRQADFTILFYRFIVIIESCNNDWQCRWTNSLSNA